MSTETDFIDNTEAIQAWDGVLYDRFVQFREPITKGLGAHGEAAMALYPPAPGQRVIDLGCGFGDTTQRLAALVGPDGHATGVDASARFIETSRREAAEAGVENISFEVADLEREIPGEGYDRAFSRMGTMFFANPVAALRNIRAALRPGALLTMVVWRQKVDNAIMFEAEQIAERFLTHPDKTDEPTCGPGPFSMANADTTSGIMVAAGFADVSLTRSDIPMWQGDTIGDAVDLVMAIGPAGELIRVNEEKGEALRSDIEQALREDLGHYETPDGVFAPTSTWLVAGTNPG